MSTSYLSPKYGSYLYNAAQDMFDTLNDGIGAKLRVADTPGEDGGFTAGGLFAPRKFSVGGMLTIQNPSGNVQIDAATFRTLRRAFYAAHAPGLLQPFWLDSDSYINAEVESASVAEWKKGLTHFPFQIGFHCADPFIYQGDGAYAAQSNSTNLNVGGAPVPPSNTAQIANPTTVPTLTDVAAATALAGGTYKVAYTWRDTYGETQISPIGTITISATDKIHVAALALPSGVTTANLYVSIAAGSLTLGWVQTWTGAAADITALPATPNSATVTPGGTVYSLPIFTVAVSAAPTGGIVYLSATGGGTTWNCLLTPSATGTYTVDGSRMRKRVTLAGADITSIFKGVFPRLATAANTVVVGVSGGAAVSAASVAWQDRWVNL